MRDLTEKSGPRYIEKNVSRQFKNKYKLSQIVKIGYKGTKTAK